MIASFRQIAGMRSLPCKHIRFLENHETGYNLFIKDLKGLNISVDKLGNYQFSK